jgi:hypothetical protein
MDRLREIYEEKRFEEEENWTSSTRMMYWPPTSEQSEAYEKFESLKMLGSPLIRDKKPLHLRVSQAKLHALMESFTAFGVEERCRFRCRSDARLYMPPERIIGEAGMVTCPDWPRPILKGFIIDGRMYRVCIA